MEKAIYFDMDGTIANFYGVKNWFECLVSHDETPYRVAKPLWHMSSLMEVLQSLKEEGYRIGVITWLSKETSPDFDKKVRAAKADWLQVYGLSSLLDEIHMVKYGTPKHTTANLRHGILVDDNAEVRMKWERYGGVTIDPIREDIIMSLKKLLKGE